MPDEPDMMRLEDSAQLKRLGKGEIVMSRLVAIIIGIVIVLVAVVVAVPLLVPTNVYKQRIVSLVKAQTGRDLVIGGDVGLSFFPRLAVKVENVSLSNPAWAREPEMATMGEMRAALKIMPLLHGDVQIDSFVLIDPVIHLEVKADGTPNWQFDSGKPAAAQQTGTTADKSANGTALRRVNLGEVSIKNGSTTYRNQQTGTSLAFEKVNLDLDLPSLDDPLNADGSLIWNSEAISFDLKAARPRALTEGGETPLEFALKSSKINAAYKGSARPLDGARFIGDVKLDVGSVRNLSAWLGNPLPAGNGFGPLTIEGKATGDSSSYTFNDAKISLDGMNATGNLSVDTGGKRPLVKGRLAVDRIDANTYLGKSDNRGASSADSNSGSSSAGDEGWSTEAIDLSALRAADADFSLNTHELFVKQVKLGESALSLKLVNGVMIVHLTKLALYEGTGSGTLTLDGSGRGAQATASFSISNVSAEPLLTDVADFKRLEGRTALSFAVQTAGRSQREMVQNLGGKGDVKFTNGAIKGINVAQLARNVLQGAVTGWQSGSSQDTDFSELGGTFTIDKGILTNSDLKMLSPLIRLAGTGTVDLPNRTLDYRITPKLATTLEGQGSTADAKGLEIPFIVDGPWSAPHFRPDLQSMLKNPQTTIDQIKSLKGEGGKELLKSLLGGDKSDTSGQTGTTEEKPKPADQLKKLFGG